MADHLKPVAEALANPVDAPIDDGLPPPWTEADLADYPPDDGSGGRAGGREAPPMRAMPDDCPVIPIGTESGAFYFITALGELRALTADKVANKHIVGMFAPDSQYLLDTWPRKKLVKSKDANTGEDIEEWIVTGWRNDDVAMLLMDVAAAKGVWNARERVRGRGAWRARDGSLIIHAGNHVLINGTWQRPGMYDNMVYPTAPSIPRPWPKPVAAGEDGPAYALLSLLRKWKWARPMIDPRLLLGWIGAAMMGAFLSYRPLAWITGDSKTGKSTLQELIGWVLGGALLQSPDASEAAVRQVLGQQSLPVAIDEAEAEEDNRKVLALVKLARIAATAAGNIMRGGQDHQGHEFQARTCFLFSSILIPPIPPQDRNRMAILELDELPSGQRQPKFDEAQMNELGEQLRRRIADRAGAFPAILEKFKDALVDFGGHNNRTAGQFGTLLAASHILLEDGMPDDQEVMDWGELLAMSGLSEAADNQPGGQECADYLLFSLVQLQQGGQQRLVSDWLLQASQPIEHLDVMVANDRRAERESARKALAKIGLAVVTGKDRDARGGAEATAVPGRDYVAIAGGRHQGLARIYADSKWKQGGWSQALGRIEGAVKGHQVKIAGRNTRATLVPIDQLLQHDAVAADDGLARNEAGLVF